MSRNLIIYYSRKGQQMLDALTRSLEHVNVGQIRRTSSVGTL